MYKYTLIALLLLPLFVAGCAGHGTRHTNRAKILPCFSFPCGGTVESRDMVLAYEVQREPSGECILSGTLMPKGAPASSKVELAVLSFELTRDLTVFYSDSFPIPARDLSQPLRFRRQFNPDGGFDGITFNWDVHLEN